jgi:antirestriction protein ArdC
MKPSIFERITQQIAEAIAKGADDYVMPWHRMSSDLSAPVNATSCRPYRGLNILTLWISSEASGYRTGQWATYRQWSSLGAQVRKGEQGTPIFFWERRHRPDDHDDNGGDNQQRAAFIAKAFTVFNAEQVSGYCPAPVPELPETERLQRAETFIQATGATIEHGGDFACYIPSSDIVRMPAFTRFKRPEAYYSVLAHELTHFTGAKHRLDRNLDNRFGTQAYAMEELIAELGAAFTCARLGIQTEPRSDHVPYIASWLKVLQGDPRAIFAAASKAQEAADYLARLTAGDRIPIEGIRVTSNAKLSV